MTAPIVRSLAALREQTRGWHMAGETIGVVRSLRPRYCDDFCKSQAI